MRWTFGFFVIFCFSSFSNPGGAKYPLDYFQAPVAQLLRLSGTFGELRPNHFHAGIDIKGGIGTPILAAADGFVSRIRVAPDGYGNHLYIEHPNGFTTVYAHLLDYAPEIQAYIRQMQFSKEEFELDIFPEPARFPVRSGQLIGRMGNTGHSFGPHLHFEIRDTKTDQALNPLLFGLKVADQIPPRLYEIKLYEFDEEMKTLNSRILPLQFRNGSYRPAFDTLRVQAAFVGVAVKVYDHMDGVSNQNGIYSLDFFLRDSLAYGFRMEAIGFDETRALNAHLDYRERSTRGSYFHRCFLLPGNKLAIYHPGKTGVVAMRPEDKQPVRMDIQDAAGNASKLEFVLQRSEPALPPSSTPAPYQYFIAHDRSHTIDDYMWYVRFPEGTFYEDLYMQYQVKEQSSASIYSPVHVLHNSSVPVHDNFVLGIRPNYIPAHLREKAFIAHRTGASATNYGGHWQEDGMLVATVRSLGYYCVMIDVTPPVIEPERISSDMRRYTSFSFKIRDNISGSANLPNLRFRATIDGTWVLMTYDEKNRRLTHTFEPILEKGTHQLELQVRDAMGNVATYKRTFIR